jgi:hypothetical protein
MQVDLQALKKSLDMQTKCLKETQADTRNDFHEELGLMFQVEAQKTKALTEANR